MRYHAMLNLPGPYGLASWAGSSSASHELSSDLPWALGSISFFFAPVWEATRGRRQTPLTSLTSSFLTTLMLATTLPFGSPAAGCTSAAPVAPGRAVLFRGGLALRLVWWVRRGSQSSTLVPVAALSRSDVAGGARLGALRRVLERLPRGVVERAVGLGLDLVLLGAGAG